LQFNFAIRGLREKTDASFSRVASRVVLHPTKKIHRTPKAFFIQAGVKAEFSLKVQRSLALVRINSHTRSKETNI
jgi:hypothetical protein